MMRIDCNWESAPQVRTPELRATWARLQITVGDEVATLVKEREAPGQIREGIDVSAYPLAEWIALNWWAVETASHTPYYSGLDLSGAGEGFPWPAMTLRSDRQQMWIHAAPRQSPDDRVRLLGNVSAVLDADEVRRTLSRFVDSTVRRLEESNIADTLLQEEWYAIQGLDDEERDFAVVAASWGFDPFDMQAEDARRLEAAADVISDSSLLADIARAVPFSELEAADEWIRTALQDGTSRNTGPRERLSGMEAFRGVSRAAPWREGYKRARALREVLGLSAVEAMPIEDYVVLTNVNVSPPGNIEALTRISATSAETVVGPRSSDLPARPVPRCSDNRASDNRSTDTIFASYAG